MPRRISDVNQTLNVFKGIAAFMVVFIHVTFPGQMGQTMECLARFAVPMFFAVSGFYSMNISTEKWKLRVKRLLIMIAVSNLIYCVWNCWICLRDGDPIQQYICNVFTVKKIYSYLMFNTSPFASHLWFLQALLYCYLLVGMIKWAKKKMSIGTVFSEREAILLICFLLVIHLVLGELFSLNSISIQIKTVRNWLFMGMPFFGIGMLLRKYAANIPKLEIWEYLLMILFLAGFSYVERVGAGKNELYFSVIPEVILIMCFVYRYPHSPGWLQNSLSFVGQNLSLYIYILHPLISKVLERYSPRFLLFYQIEMHPYIKPIVVCILTWFVSLVIYEGMQLCKRRKRLVRNRLQYERRHF